MHRSSKLESGKAKSAKRKITDTPGPDDLPQQRTIADLFSNSKSQSPPNKRLKRDLSDPATASPLPPDKMYSFTSSRPNGTVDLTTSPAKSSPRSNSISGRPSNFAPNQGSKKLVVKNLRTTPKGNADQYLSKVLGQLDEALTEIFQDEQPTQSLEELYKGTENLCRQGRASDINKKLVDRCKTHISTTLKNRLLEKAAVGKPVDTLRAVVEAWLNWNRQLMMLRSIFYYMDQSYLLRSTTESTINEMGLIQFRTHVFSECLLRNRIFQGACDLVEYDRRRVQNMVDSDLLKRAIGMFHDLRLYTSSFEPLMLEESSRFFATWADRESAEKPLAQFVKDCHDLIQSEETRCNLFSLDSSTRRELNLLVDENLVTRQKSALLNKDSILDLLEDEDTKALEQLYTLLERRHLGGELKESFGAYIIDTGSDIVFDEKREGEMVPKLLKLKDGVDEVWKKSFHRHESLGHTLRQSFETFINKTKKTAANWGTDNPKPGEMIAKHVDTILRGGAKAVRQSLSASRSTVIVQDEDNHEAGGDEDAEISIQLDQVLDLFRFVHGKAVFEAFYKRDLARRLLMARSASADAESSMLTRLNKECGSNFTHNLEQMFKDMELARDEMISYKSRLNERGIIPEIDLSVNVLSSSAWPTYPDVAVNVPDSISKAVRDFDMHYNSKHSGRKLTWKHNLAHCQLKASFPKGDKEIVVSSFQAIVLLLFNDTSNRTYEDIQNATGLADDELKRTLQSLACAKYRVLAKTPKGRDVNSADTFAYNTAFSDPKYRIKINQIQLKETKAENKETHERVAADRHYETQAAIVRIMKGRKTIKHAELVAEVITATKSRGVLDPADIKRNIEKLIEKDYMEREEGNVYNYLA